MENVITGVGAETTFGGAPTTSSTKKNAKALNRKSLSRQSQSRSALIRATVATKAIHSKLSG
jgi:hypothetical protein